MQRLLGLVSQSRMRRVLYSQENWYLQRTQRTCRLTSHSGHCVRIRTAVSFLLSTAKCKGVLLLLLCWTFGSKPFSSNSFKASPLSSLNDHKDLCATRISGILEILHYFIEFLILLSCVVKKTQQQQQRQKPDMNHKMQIVRVGLSSNQSQSNQSHSEQRWISWWINKQ